MESRKYIHRNEYGCMKPEQRNTGSAGYAAGMVLVSGIVGKEKSSVSVCVSRKEYIPVALKWVKKGGGDTFFPIFL